MTNQHSFKRKKICEKQQSALFTFQIIQPKFKYAYFIEQSVKMAKKHSKNGVI